MTVETYVSRDFEGRPWPPDYSSEINATIGIVQRLWWAFNLQKSLYAVVANLHDPSADLVFISERGLGVVELKYYYGSFKQKSDGAWYAGPVRIKAGAESQGYRNPHEQVQAYATQIREKFITLGRDQLWLVRQDVGWEDFKFHTAVCFTHPDASQASVESFERSLRQHRRLNMEKWEQFSILKPDGILKWVTALRFEVDRGQRYDHEPYLLHPHQIRDIATDLLGGTKWTEIDHMMPTGEPYAYLTRVDGARPVQVFGLAREEIFVGRDANRCTVPVPTRFTYVGRVHAHITRSGKRVFIKDLKSRNGTFINGQPVEKGKRTQLISGQKITLGGPAPGDKVCQFEFSLNMSTEPATPVPQKTPERTETAQGPEG